jgi:hypothetical protein
MLQYKIQRGKLTSLSYRVGDVVYDLGYLKSTPAWDMLGSLILAGDVDAANELYKLGFSIAASKNWNRVKSGHWSVQYAGHIIYVRSTDTVETFLPAAAEIAYYIRRRWYEQRVAQTAKRDTRRLR